MEQETVYRKTALGQEALARRDPALVPRERAMLIVVDGRRNVGELAGLGNAEEILPALAARGLIEVVLQPRPAPAEPPPEATEAASAPTAPLPFPAAQRLAVRRLTDLLGPQATDLCLQVEKARSAQEFAAVLRQLEGAVRQALGAQAAARFMQEFGKVRPG